MKPPLAQSGVPSQKSIRVTLPLMSTRRIGAACEAAQTSSPAKQPVRPVTLIVRLEIERQKLSWRSTRVWTPLVHWFQESIVPLITTWPGFWPRPSTLS